MPDPRSDIGPILEYLRDVTKLPPELVRIEHLTFYFTIAAQAITERPTAQRVDPEYVFALRRIRAFGSAPGTNIVDFHRVEFNVRDQGRARGGLFANPINLAMLVGSAGPVNEALWDGFYAFVPGSDVQVDFATRTALTTFLSQGNLTIGVSLFGDLVRVRRLADGRLIIPGVSPESQEALPVPARP